MHQAQNEKLKLNANQIKISIEKLQSFMKNEGIDLFYISSFDPYLSEYVPLSNCHRYYVSGFTGSVAHCLVPLKGKVKIFVDGRYHEQVDKEIDHQLVEAIKVPLTSSINQAMFDEYQKLSPALIGVEGNRLPLSFERRFATSGKLKIFDHEEIDHALGLSPYASKNEVTLLDQKFRSKEVKEKLGRIIKSPQVSYFLTALDDIAWLTNCRGYQLPYLSSFMAQALATFDKVFVFVSPDCKISSTVLASKELEFIHSDCQSIEGELAKIQKTYQLKEVRFDSSLITGRDFRLLGKVFDETELMDVSGGLNEFKMIKDEKELAEMKRSFVLASKAIFDTISWVREQIKQKKSPSELDLYNKANECYQKHGAVGLSFKTIAAVGPNSSVVHFSSPSAEVKIHPDSLLLLDSGGYWESGFATDTTRSFLASGDSQDAQGWQKEIYTCVLKSFIKGHLAEVKQGTGGDLIDKLVRGEIQKHGYDYAHGTGHGVGIHVHEDGIRFSSAASLPILAGQAVSIEPGIYLPGKGGVRTENVIYVEEHPDKKGFVRFKPFTLVGLDHSLIDTSLLSGEEKEYIDQYEKECANIGTSFVC